MRGGGARLDGMRVKMPPRHEVVLVKGNRDGENAQERERNAEGEGKKRRQPGHKRMSCRLDVEPLCKKPVSRYTCFFG